MLAAIHSTVRAGCHLVVLQPGFKLTYFLHCKGLKQRPWAMSSANATSAMELAGFEAITVFGVQTADNADIIARQMKLLYGETVLSEKEKKKLEKAQKFAAKKAASTAQPQATEKAKKGKKEATKEVIAYNYVPPPKGQKKKMAELAPKYDPKIVEDAWYEWWLKEGFFKPEYSEQHQHKSQDPNSDSFTIIIPPPNVTGTLHLGHALTTAIEDSITRWYGVMGGKASKREATMRNGRL